MAQVTIYNNDPANVTVTVINGDPPDVSALQQQLADANTHIATLQSSLDAVTADDNSLKAKLVNVQAAADAVEAALKA